MLEKIDRPEGKEDPTQELINELTDYISSGSIARRLQLERKLGKYIENNNIEWILNFLVRCHNEWKQKEKK